LLFNAFSKIFANRFSVSVQSERAMRAFGQVA
jgi:hypothetical protein